jgi:transcription antitermination factor NusG
MQHADRPPFGEASWQLVYTKSRAERWVELNLRRQHFHTLLPLVRGRTGFQPLFPRYIFVGISPDASARPIAGTRGVQYIVHFGSQPARVPLEVVRDVHARMDAHGVVALEQADPQDPLFAKHARAAHVCPGRVPHQVRVVARPFSSHAAKSRVLPVDTLSCL